jgi:hypothetical protein
MTRTHPGCAIALLLAAACADVRRDPDAALMLGSAVPAPVISTNGATGAAQPATSGSGLASPDPVHAEGLRLYREQYCGMCHAFAAAGTAGIFGPPHDDMPAIAEQRIHDVKYAGSATTAEEYLRESLLEPGAYRVPGYERTRFLMPAYTNLSEGQVDALIHLLLDPGNGGT